MLSDSQHYFGRAADVLGLSPMIRAIPYGAESRSSQNASTSVDFTALAGTRFSLAPPRRLT